MRIRAGGRFHAERRLPHVVVAGPLAWILLGCTALLLVGCTVGSASSGPESSVSSVSSSGAVPAVVAGAGVVVTVPDLASPGLVSPGLASPGSRSAGSKPAPRPSSAGSSVARPARSSTLFATSPSPSSVSSSSASAAPNTSVVSTTSASGTFEVRLVDCAVCTVLATHAAVTPKLGAALVATGPGHAALLSIKGDGGVAGAVNLLYGSTFPNPPGGQLPCDSGGRCIVIAQQVDGAAIASAYQVSAAGAWTHVTGQPGITSATAVAQTLVVGDGLGVAVQDQADGSTVWTVYTWDGDGYSVKGCTAATTPEVSTLTMASCLS